MPQTDYLADQLTLASIEAPADNYVNLQRMILGRSVETAIFQHPPSTITFPGLHVGHGGILHFGCGVKETAWLRMQNEVRFTISIESDTGVEILFDGAMHPRLRTADRRWQNHQVDLSRFEGKSIRVILQTKMAGGSNAYGWAGWANPRITHTLPPRPRPAARRDAHPHIFLLTADALPARYLGCYGHPQVQTPHVDQLAAEGVLFDQAWSQSCLTLGSYASILTARYPHEHGVTREWRPFPTSQLSLPVALEAHGYHTLFLPSSTELLARASSPGQVFNETIPTLANPNQNGEISTRQFTRWLDQRSDRACFAWLHYFDIHPPSLPPEPFRSMYYTGDPTLDERRYSPNQVAQIRGVESLLILRATMPLLERGQPVAEVTDILEDTAAVLTGRHDLRPDLVDHLLNLGASHMHGHSPAQFGHWLFGQTKEMAAGRVPGKLVEWLKQVMTELEIIEMDIVSWLRGVADFRFPLAMHMGTISYFDSHIGALVDYLKEEDLYDQSLIIVTAPHGELLDDPILSYHHLSLAPDTLRVPLIMKLPDYARDSKTGFRVGGVFDLIDLFPTIMDIQGLQNSFKFSGVSRWEHIRRGANIPPHDSFATGLHQMAHSIYRPPYLLVREQPGTVAQTLHALLSGAREVVFDTASGEVYQQDLPEVAGGLRRSLDLNFNSKS
jgi:Sulfatase